MSSDRILVETLYFLLKLDRKVSSIMATEAEILADLDLIKAQQVKIGLETSSLLDKISELEALVAAGANLTAIAAKVAEIKAQGQLVDDLVVDAPA